MTDPQQITGALRAARPIVLAPHSADEPTRIPPSPNDVWDLPGGTAWVYWAEGNPGALTRPVILADGFNSGPSTPDFLWNGLDWTDYPLLTELRRRGRDVILLGFAERSASILDNAEAAKAAIFEAISRRLGNTPLVVGGFSMGGLVTRYALAKLEREKMDHQTAVYWSWDSPHRGAYIPIALQAFAHYIAAFDPRFSDQMNSAAARQLLAWHLPDWSGVPAAPDPLRTEFLQALERVGQWPQVPRLLGLANGRGDGVGNGIGAGETAVLGTGEYITGTDLRTQPLAPDTLAAKIRLLTEDVVEVQAPGIPPVDGAPGGTLDGFAILSRALNALAELGFDVGVENPVEDHCFVPSVSAVSVRDILTRDDLFTDVSGLRPEESELDAYTLATDNGAHTQITEELATWFLDRLAD